MTIDVPKFYDKKQVAEMLGVTTRTVQQYITDGKIPAKIIGGKWRIKEEDLKKFLNME